MNYESVLLDLDFEEAEALVGRRVSGLSTRTVQGSIEYFSGTGHHLAELSTTTLPNGKSGSKLTYRTAIISPTEAHARRRAKEIYGAVSEARY